MTEPSTGPTTEPDVDTLDVAVAELRPALEALLMVADQPLDVATLASATGHPVPEVDEALAALARPAACRRRRPASPAPPG